MIIADRFLLGLALVAGLILGGCGDGSGAGKQDSGGGPGVIRFGGEELGGAPYAFKSAGNPDKRVGFEVEIMEEVGRRLGRQVKFVPNDWDTLLMALNRGDFDVAMSGVEITPERSREVAFSAPYYVSTQQLVVRAADTGVNSLDDLQGKVVGTLRESTSEQLLRSKYPQIETRVYDDVMRPYDELEIGHVDGVLLDLAIAEYHAAGRKDLKFAGKPFAPGEYAMALRKDETALLGQINGALQEMRADGTLQSILEKWKLWNDAQVTSGTVSTEE